MMWDAWPGCSWFDKLICMHALESIILVNFVSCDEGLV